VSVEDANKKKKVMSFASLLKHEMELVGGRVIGMDYAFTDRKI
jgi:hypothetical protein